MTTITSGASARISETASSALIRFGCRIGPAIPAAAALIGGASIRCSRPTGLSGWVTTPTSSCLPDSISHRKTGTPISPVPMNNTRIARSELDALHRGAAAGTARRRCPGHHFLAGRDFALSDGRRAAGAKIIVDFLVGQDQEKAFAHRHRGLALLAIEVRGSEILKLLLTHALRSLHR